MKDGQSNRLNGKIRIFFFLIVAALICMSVYMMKVHADDVNLAGAGTEMAPYVIYTAADLLEMNHDLGAYYILADDIDLDEAEWEPIGSAAEPFRGVLDGRGHSISNFTIFQMEAQYLGLFARLSDSAKVTNLHIGQAMIVGQGLIGVLAGAAEQATIENITIEQSDISVICENVFECSGDNRYLGGVVGYAEHSRFLHVHVKKPAMSDTSIIGFEHVGGLIGYGEQIELYNSSAEATVYGIQLYTGGLVGELNGGIVANSFTRSQVFSGGQEEYGFYDGYTGGLIGYVNEDRAATVRDAYSASLVFSVSNDHVGGLIGANEQSIYDSYWDMDFSMQLVSAGGIGKSLAEMQDASTYDGWDRTDWDVDAVEHGHYPQLRGNAYLSSLEVNTESLDYHYGLAAMQMLEMDQESFTVSAIASAYDAEIEVTVESSLAPGSLAVPPNAAHSHDYDFTFEEGEIKTIEIAVTASDGNKKVYQLVVERSITPPVVPPDPLLLVAESGDRQVDLQWNTVTGATYYELYMSIGAATFTEPAIATVTGTTYSVQELSNGTPYYFIVKAGGLTGFIVESNQATATPVGMVPPVDDEDETPTSPPGPTAPTETESPDPENVNIDIIINGKIGSLGQARTIKDKNGQNKRIITLHEEQIEQQLAEEEDQSNILIPTESDDRVIVELSGRLVKNMELNQSVIELITARASMSISAHQVDIEQIAEHYDPRPELEELKVSIEITPSDTETADMVNDIISDLNEDKRYGELNVLIPPVDFRIFAEAGGDLVDISEFGEYVVYRIAISSELNPDQITTGVWLTPEGTMHHVPTKVVLIDGQYYAQVSSLYNGTFTLISHSIQFSDMFDHWALAAAHNLGARLILHGNENGQFQPEHEATRAQFAEMMVQALGLRSTQGDTLYTDLNTSSEGQLAAIRTAHTYGLINGFGDQTFRPDEKMTREQAIVVIVNAIKLILPEILNPSITGEDILYAYDDAAHVSEWAASSVAASIQAGIISGRNENELAPKAFVTKAEVAILLERLLQKLGLI